MTVDNRIYRWWNRAVLWGTSLWEKVLRIYPRGWTHTRTGNRCTAQCARPVVCLFVHLSMCVSICLSNYLCVCAYIYIYLSANIPVCKIANQNACLSACLPLSQCICRCVYKCHRSAPLSANLPICLSS